MPDEIFGPLGAFTDVEYDLLSHIKLWIPAYLDARARKKSIDPVKLPKPKSWIVRQTFNELPGEDRTPAIIAVSSGTSDEPNNHGDGNYDVSMRIAVAALCHGREADQARRMAGHYQAALVTLLIHKKVFGIAKVNRWLGFALDDVEETATRTLCAARMEFVVVVRDFVSDYGGGPRTPPADPVPVQPGWPEVLTTDVKLNSVSEVTPDE